MKKKMTTLARITLGLSVLATLSLGSCYNNDPLKEKERQAELKKQQKEEPNKQPENKPDNPNKPKSDPEKPEPNQGEKHVQTRYDFERWAAVPKTKYFVPLLNDQEDPSMSYWVSASNHGYNMLAKRAEDFPVLPLKEGKQGQGALLRTIEGIKIFGIGADIIAGSLHTGLINKDDLFNPAWFGQECSQEPRSLSFYYQYRAGKKNIGKVEGGVDQGSVQGILYEVTKDARHLDAKTVKNDPRIVSRAYMLLGNTPENEWKEGKIVFEPVNEELYKGLDFVGKKYRLALIISSSAAGDEFVGAIGSELKIDELVLESKDNRK